MVNSLLVLSVTVQFKIPTITKVSRYSNSAIIGNSSTAREDIEHIFIYIQCMGNSNKQSVGIKST